MAIKEGDFIRLSYSGTVNGNVFDTTDGEEAKKAGIHSPNALYGPVTICVGQKHVIIGLDEELVGKKAGASGSVTVSPEKAFGDRDPAKIQSYPRISSARNRSAVCRSRSRNRAKVPWSMSSARRSSLTSMRPSQVRHSRTRTRLRRRSASRWSAQGTVRYAWPGDRDRHG